MLLGNIKVYEKARAALAPDRPEIALLDHLITENLSALAFEQAIDRIIDGNTTRGLADLRVVQSRVSGPVWALAFAVWRLFPALARPMLSRRRELHRRGAVETRFLAGLLRPARPSR
jgi:hypothetical protein